jgi:hypothetical protein
MKDMGRRPKLTTEQVDAALLRMDMGESAEEIAKEFGTSDTRLYAWRKERQQIKQGMVVQTRHLSHADNVVKCLKQECQEEYGSAQPSLKEIRYYLMLDYSHASAYGAKSAKLLEKQAVRMCEELDGLSEECGWTEEGRPTPSEFDIKVNRINAVLKAATLAATLPGGILLKDPDGKAQGLKDVTPDKNPKIPVKSLPDDVIKRLNEIADEAERLLQEEQLKLSLEKEESC